MSMWLAAQVWNCKLDKTRMVIFMALCDSAEDDGSSCYPSPRYIAWKTGTGKTTVYRLLAEFEERRYIEQVGTKGDLIEYVIHIENVPIKPAFDRAKRGRPRQRKDSRGGKRIPPREKNSTTGKDSQGEKKIPVTENVFPPREAFSRGGKKNHRLDTSPAPDNSEVGSKRDASYPSISTQVYDPALENSGAPSITNWLSLPENRELRNARYAEKITAYDAWCAAQGLEPVR